MIGLIQNDAIDIQNYINVFARVVFNDFRITELANLLDRRKSIYL